MFRLLPCLTHLQQHHHSSLHVLVGSASALLHTPPAAVQPSQQHAQLQHVQGQLCHAWQPRDQGISHARWHTTATASGEPSHTPVAKREAMQATTDLNTIIRRQKGPRGFQVIEFSPSGLAKEWRKKISPEALGIHPRDLSLFSKGSRLAPQRATIQARDSVIFLKTEAVRAIVRYDKAIVLKSCSERENRNIIAPMLQASDSLKHTPFELCALEVLLHATLNYFERRVSHLTWMIDIALHDLQSNGSDNDPLSTVGNETFQQLLPLGKALTEVRNDAKEVSDAILQVLSNDAALAAMCLTERATALAEGSDSNGGAELGDARLVSTGARLQTTRVLQSYEREMSSIVLQLLEMEENLDTTRETWAVRLDSARNQLMVLNVLLSMLSISLTVSLVLPSLLGMNVQHGFENSIPLFYLLAAVSMAAGVASFPGMIRYYKRRWGKRESRLKHVNRFRAVLMNHLDDLDDILEACHHMPAKVTRSEFGAFLKCYLPRLNKDTLKEDTLDFLFQQLDVNKDGRFEPQELLSSSTRELEALGRVATDAQLSGHVMRSTAMLGLQQQQQQQAGGQGGSPRDVAVQAR